ncbi:MAG: SDR family oxidoreductase [Spirochaetales bacterium]|nr:SDR family oxidoreductase [Spirochaetales bacterium]
MIDISGKWALITGASRGIGRQIAYGLAQKGCNLVLHSRNLAHTEKLAQELKQKGIDVLQLEADLSDSDATQRLAEEAENKSGGINILYNNAAVMTPYLQAFTAPPEDYRKSFMVNVISPIIICDVIVPHMIKRGFGRVINVTSGIQDEPELMPYAISKAALDKYVKDLAKRLSGTGVIMSLLDPGWLRTDLGGPKAPNSVESVLPGALVPALLGNEAQSGNFFRAQDYKEE